MASIGIGIGIGLESKPSIGIGIGIALGPQPSIGIGIDIDLSEFLVLVLRYENRYCRSLVHSFFPIFNQKVHPVLMCTSEAKLLFCGPATEHKIKRVAAKQVEPN